MGTIVYLILWPRDLFRFDEGLYLYESKRLLDGDVFYRDIFEIITPGAFYLMAGLYWLFGVSMLTARMSMAVLHAIIVTAIYLACRSVGTRRMVATAAAVAHMAICYSAAPTASPHRVGTLLVVILLLLALRWRTPSARRAAVFGLFVGALVAVQQQKGLVMSVAVPTLLTADHLLAWRARRSPETSLVVELAAYAVGVATLVVPLFVGLVAAAGWHDVFKDLVRAPLVNYRGTLRSAWGAYPAYNAKLYAFPQLLAFQPVVIGIAALRIGWQWLRDEPTDELRNLQCLTILPAFAMLSIMYFPNYTHLAIVAPVCLPLVGETLEWILRFGERVARVPAFAGTVLGLILIARLGVQLRQNLEQRHQMYPLTAPTPFGLVGFPFRDEIEFVEAIRQLMPEGGPREFFAYPHQASWYLVADGRNPTRYQVVLKDYSGPEIFDEVLGTLEARKVPLVAVARTEVKWKNDPILAYLAEKYELVPLPFTGKFRILHLYKRKDGV